MNIASVHIDALLSLGYTEAEVRFFYIVATHSAYFVAANSLLLLMLTGTAARPPSGTNCKTKTMQVPNAVQRAERAGNGKGTRVAFRRIVSGMEKRSCQ